jgi:hypothetical protein
MDVHFIEKKYPTAATATDATAAARGCLNGR